MAPANDNPGDASCAPDQPIKRAPVVYGKRLNHHAVDEHEQSFESDHVQHGPVVPMLWQGPSASPSIHAPASKRLHGPGAADSFQFGFRHRLKELDEQFDSRDAQSPKPGRSPSGRAMHVEPSQAKAFEGVSMGTTIPSSEVPRPSGDLPRASLSSSPTTLRATCAQESPLASPIVCRRAGRLSAPSDLEKEESSKSSSVSPVRHAITTPHARSSPTPPTSGEVQMVSRKAKGKAPTRDVLPLLFDDEPPSAVEFPAKSKKGKRSESLVRPRTKAPTKKERREAAFESSRIAANCSVEVIRTQQQKHSLSTFFAGLRQDNIVALSTELPSDPIDRFSSPTDNPTQGPPLGSVFGPPTGLLKPSAHVGTGNQPSSSKNTEALPPMADDSDDEMLSVTSIIKQADGKQQRLQTIKQAALQHAGTGRNFGISSEDDDLLIVKDDMHAVAREEAAQRRLDKALGSPIKDLASLRKINHPSVRPAMVSPRKLSKQELQELAKPSFARAAKGAKGQLSKKELDQLMIKQHTREQLRTIKRHEEEWIKGGGKLLRDCGGDGTQTSLSEKLGTYAEQGLRAAETDNGVGDEASADDSDEDYTPELRGSASPEPTDVGKDYAGSGDNTEDSPVPYLPVDDDDDEATAPLRRRNKTGQRNSRVVFRSDDEGGQPVHRYPPVVQRDSTSSMESQTEDENDKENSAKLMYDRSEDKENKAVVRHELSPSDMALGSRLGSLQSMVDGVPKTLPLASATDFSDATESLEGNIRSPLKDISKDDDLFLSPQSSKSPFTECLLRSATISPPRTTTSTLSLGSPPVLRSERISRINRLSLDSENDENDPSRFKPLQPSFLERLQTQVCSEPSFAAVNPLLNGGFSQLFSAEDGNLKKPVDATKGDGLSLTLDVGLKPALEVNGTLRQKAEGIFNKEQEYVVAVAVQRDKPKELLYINDHGFLTQTRPEDSSPRVYCMTPSQASKFIGTQVHSTQTEPLSLRPPLRTLSFAISQELSPEQRPLKRLRKRSPSPLERKIQSNNPIAKSNAFSVLGKSLKPPSKVQKEKHEKSEFVAVEAEESDEDDMFGFGGRKMEEEEDDNEQDKIVEGLLDDAVMDAETEAVNLVQEKYREHEGEDDQRLQKLHQDAIEGKFRMKRRDRGVVGFEDESDEDEDEDERRIRQRMHKRRKIEGDSLESLGQNEETRAFYNTYHQDLIDEDDEFEHPREDDVMPVENDGQAEGHEERETLSVDEIRQRVRDMAQNNAEMEMLDPEDTSWIDQSMMVEADDAIRVKVIENRRSRPTARSGASQMDFDGERPKRHVESEQERKQMMFWAKNQSRQHQGTGRSGNSAAVTGHTKAKAGGGSLRPTQLSRPAIVNETHKITKSSSLLSTVSNRKGKFA